MSGSTGYESDYNTCGYLSHALTHSEQNWQIYNRELYAIIYALDEWKYLLLGAEHTLTIHCDHKKFNLLQNATTSYCATGKMVD